MASLADTGTENSYGEQIGPEERLAAFIEETINTYREEVRTHGNVDEAKKYTIFRLSSHDKRMDDSSLEAAENIAREAISAYSKRSMDFPHSAAVTEAVQDIIVPGAERGLDVRNFSRSVIDSCRSNPGAHSMVLDAHASIAEQEGRADFMAAIRLANSAITEYEIRIAQGTPHHDAREAAVIAMDKTFDNHGLTAEEREGPGQDYEPDYYDEYGPTKTVHEEIDQDGYLTRTTTLDTGNEQDGYTNVKTTEELFKDGALIGTHISSYVRDDEGSISEDEWLNAEGQRHRVDGPAYSIEKTHYIPEETYLDEARKEFWKDGQLVESVDRTYEDIISYKPIAVQQAFGYAVDGPEPVDLDASEAIEYGDDLRDAFGATRVAEQERLLSDPARSFETPTPTADDQLREAAIAGLTEASALEVWQQTRNLIMTEDFDAVDREQLLSELGAPPPRDAIVMLTPDGQEVEAVGQTTSHSWTERVLEEKSILEMSVEDRSLAR